MTWLITHFIKNAENTADPSVRHQYAELAGRTGIFANILLFIVKLLIGILSHSVSVLSDAFNNLSDSLSSLISLAASRYSAKEADKDHPYGHGRAEYLATLIICGVIFSAAFELFSSSVSRILHPEPVYGSLTSALILAGTILVKLWLSAFYHKVGTLIHHSGILASAEDSRNDVIATLLTIGSMLFGLTGSEIPADGIAGAVVSVYIFWSGFTIAKEIITKLLGDEADPALREKIEALIRSRKEILGVHDLILHDYGPEHTMGTVHAELPSDMSLLEAHEVIDSCEREVREQLGVDLTIHPDPVSFDEATLFWRKEAEGVIRALGPDYLMHDFRIRREGDLLVLSFDLVCPLQKSQDDHELLTGIETELKKKDSAVVCRITFDHGYLSHTEKNA